MKKILLSIMMMVLIISSAYGLTLVDSEDFDSYTVNTESMVVLNNESNNKWRCGNDAYLPDCVDQQGAGGDDAYFRIKDDGTGNQVLRLLAIDTNLVVADYDIVELKWNHINVSQLSIARNHSYSYDLRLLLHGGDHNGQTGGGWYEFYYGMLDNSNDYINSAGSQWIATVIGGIQPDAGTEENWTRMRPIWNSNGAWANPNTVSSNCSMIDGQWHTITQHLGYNSSNDPVIFDVYVDTDLCYSRTSNVLSESGGFVPYTVSLFKVHRNMSVDIDNIYLYDGLITPSEFTYDCDDGIDNDGDGFIDYPDDTGCNSTTDNSELPVAVTTCETWELPYYVVESFTGNLTQCDWIVSDELTTGGELNVPNTIGYYYAQKETDLAEEDNTQYVTMTFDLNVHTITVIGSTITFRLYDSDNFNFVTLYFRDTGDYLWYNDGGTGRIATTIPNNVSLPYKFVIDFDNDLWDIYVNGSKVVDDADFTNSFSNIIDLQTFKMTSSDANWTIDNLKIFASDSTGTPLLPDEDLDTVVQPDLAMCELFNKNPSTCTTDDDCTTGICLANNKCSGFDYTYCDDNSMVRGNKCVLAGMTSCVLTSTKDIIFDNFLLFLVFLVLIMIAVYLAIMFKRSD